jgi:hypothetical protein
MPPGHLLNPSLDFAWAEAICEFPFVQDDSMRK